MELSSQLPCVDITNHFVGQHFAEAANAFRRLRDLNISVDEQLSSRNRQMLADLARERLEVIHYSDDMQSSVKATAIDFAETTLKTPYYIRAANQWDDIRGDEDKLKKFSVTMQRVLAKCLSKHRGWGDVERKTSFNFYTSAPIIMSNGDEGLLKGEFILRGVRQMTDGRTRHLETIGMNIHPHGAIKSPVSWLSTMFHENVHAVEAIERQRLNTMTSDQILADRDIQILLADHHFPDCHDFRVMCYDAYQALPRERLARLGQTAFEQRMVA